MINIIDNDVGNIQAEINDLETTSQQHVGKELYYHTNHTYFMYQRKNTIHKYDNRRSFITQNHYFTYQRKGHQELQIQLSNTIVADLQNQVNNLSNSNPPPDEDPEIGYA